MIFPLILVWSLVFILMGCTWNFWQADDEFAENGIVSEDGLKNLKKLFLWQSKATEEGANKLAEAIPGLDVNTGWKAAAPAPAEEKAPAPKPGEKLPTVYSIFYFLALLVLSIYSWVNLSPALYL